MSNFKKKVIAGLKPNFQEENKSELETKIDWNWLAFNFPNVDEAIVVVFETISNISETKCPKCKGNGKHNTITQRNLGYGFKAREATVKCELCKESGQVTKTQATEYLDEIKEQEMVRYEMQLIADFQCSIGGMPF